MAQSSLSDLCSIWLVLSYPPSSRPRSPILISCSYTQIPKYRCPRCKTQTCSLPCYKRHQQRASCNGKRDPAAYLKKSQLATAASVDRDYNYLKSVERSIDDASTDARERGAGLTGDSQSRGPRREGVFSRYLASNGIVVEHAPKGLSRQKNNRSRVTKNGQVYWTIEWRDDSTEQELRHDAPESSVLSELYKGVQTSKRKRKAAAGVVGDGAPSHSKRPKGSDGLTGTIVATDTPAKSGTADTLSGKQSPPDGLDVTNGSDVQQHEESPAKQQRESHLYLLKPSTTGPSRVLIPIDPSKTLTKILEGQTVQEYPTIYVLHDPPDSLPTGFNHVDHEVKTSSHGLPTTTRALQSGEDVAKSELDVKSILDMLKRDVRT